MSSPDRATWDLAADVVAAFHTVADIALPTLLTWARVKPVGGRLYTMMLATGRVQLFDDPTAAASSPATTNVGNVWLNHMHLKPLQRLLLCVLIGALHDAGAQFDLVFRQYGARPSVSRIAARRFARMFGDAELRRAEQNWVACGDARPKPISNLINAASFYPGRKVRLFPKSAIEADQPWLFATTVGIARALLPPDHPAERQPHAAGFQFVEHRDADPGQQAVLNRRHPASSLIGASHEW